MCLEHATLPDRYRLVGLIAALVVEIVQIFSALEPPYTLPWNERKYYENIMKLQRLLETIIKLWEFHDNIS